MASSPSRGLSRPMSASPGPGPDLPEDIRDVGFSSMAVKLMGVPGPKLMPDEQHTQDLIAVCTPTFVTPNTRENAKLQLWSFQRSADLLLPQPARPAHARLPDAGTVERDPVQPARHPLLELRPYLLGEGQAMMYSFRPRSDVITDIPGVPFGKVPPNYLRDNLIATLARQDAEFDLLVQVQTDPHAMPVENARSAGRSACRRSCRWPRSTSPAEARHSGPCPVHAALVDESLALHSRAPAAWATRAGRASGCTTSSAGCGRTATRRHTWSRRATRYSTSS